MAGIVREVEVFDKATCLRIAKQFPYNTECDDEEHLLYYLPDRIFGRSHEVDYIAECVVVYDRSTTNGWHIPPYFIAKMWPDTKEARKSNEV